MTRIESFYKTVKQNIYYVLEFKRHDAVSVSVNAGIVTLILANVAMIILETDSTLNTRFSTFFHYFELISVVIFSAEYLLRFWVCNINEKYQKPIVGRLQYCIMPLAVIDLFAVLPYYLSDVFSIGLLSGNMLFLRSVRLIRIARLFKLGRYSSSISTLTKVFKAKKNELLVAASIIFMLLVVASSCMFLAEHDAQPDKFSSIPATMWWSICTISTIGYGDMYPVTVIGKMLAGAIALTGIALFGLPAGILVAGFIEITHKPEKHNATCPHCGKSLGLVNENN
jgi:voltage-gated potassium channel